MYIELTLYSMSPWEERLESLVTLLDSQTLFRPERWGRSEPLKHPFALDDLKVMQENWSRYCGFMFKKQKPEFWIDTLWRPQCKRPGWFHMGIEEDFFKKPNNIQLFLKFAMHVYQWGDMVYGFACHWQDFNRKNKLTKPTMINGKLIATGGMDISRCLPGIYWANFFSRIYVEWFGKDIIHSAPCYDLGELPGGGALILTTHTPLAYNNADQIESRLQAHLGTDAFFDKNQPARACRSPFKPKAG